MAKKNKYGLNDKQQLFADYYLANNCNAVQAYLEAYKCDYNSAKVRASKLLTKVNVKSYIGQRQAEIREKTTVTQEYIIEKLKTVVERSLQEQPVMKFDYDEKQLVQETVLDDTGREIGVFTYDSAGANKALELLGKTLGIYKDKKELSTGPGGFVVNLVDDVSE